MRSGSVRLRAALGATAVVAAALVAVGLLVVSVLRSGLADNAALAAEAQAREVAAQTSAAATGDVHGLDALDDDPIQVVDADGRVLGASDHLEGEAPFADFHRPERASQDRDDEDDDPDDEDDRSAEPDADSGSEEETVTFPVDDDGEPTRAEDAVGEQDFGVVAVRTTTADGTPVTVYAGASLRDQEEAVATVTRAMLVGLPVLLVVVAGVTWLVVRRALRPVEGIRREMGTITASADLGRRVPVPDSRDEIARLAHTTNETLAALETSTERQRRFVADASHELRSPIASLRTQLEVAEAHPELLDLPGAVTDTVRLQQLAADLLLLARLDAGERPQHGRFSPAELVREELSQRAGHRVAPRAESLVPDEVAGSRGQFGRVLRNLLDNAERHARSEVRVRMRRESPGRLELAVEDDGPGVPEAERRRIFERFVRLDDARSRDEGGAGLGLAIARDVAERHGGTLTVGQSPAGGASFVLRVPTAEGGRPPVG
ncbi:sensor histidine kinase [Streptomyces xiaopingdaonensis]|uniref:sensor histidine kinase n=1 Tax=Streptomyces xiaopingdaonensis TaxID=1565415 RepID=UPI0003826585|nr:HAMP domain-containing sensor histidine kinase [Streptomyces xiaopingdaonensis]